MLVGFTVEENCPEFAQGTRGAGLGAEECVANPKRERANGVIGPQKEALIMPLGLTLKSGVIDLSVEGL